MWICVGGAVGRCVGGAVVWECVGRTVTVCDGVTEAAGFGALDELELHPLIAAPATATAAIPKSIFLLCISFPPVKRVASPGRPAGGEGGPEQGPLTATGPGAIDRLDASTVVMQASGRVASPGDAGGRMLQRMNVHTFSHAANGLVLKWPITNNPHCSCVPHRAYTSPSAHISCPGLEQRPPDSDTFTAIARLQAFSGHHPGLPPPAGWWPSAQLGPGTTSRALSVPGTMPPAATASTPRANAAVGKAS